MLPSSPFHRLAAVVLALVLTVGITGCDSSGTQDSDDENDTPEVAKTFNVTVEALDSSYPYSDQNRVGVAYAIDGEVGKVITLERGKTYAFSLGARVSPNHPFYVGTTAEGGGGDEFRDRPAKETTGTVTFTVPASAPSALFYVCDTHIYMGGEIRVSDP